MNTTEATNVAVRLVPGHTVICNERYQSTQHGDRRTEGLEYLISVHPALTGPAPCQQFHGPSFEHCLQQLATTCTSADADADAGTGTSLSLNIAGIDQPGSSSSSSNDSSSCSPAPGCVSSVIPAISALADATLLASSIS